MFGPTLPPCEDAQSHFLNLYLFIFAYVICQILHTSLKQNMSHVNFFAYVTCQIWHTCQDHLQITHILAHMISCTNKGWFQRLYIFLNFLLIHNAL